jgi:outer membrane biosynthesis protein TonB
MLKPEVENRRAARSCKGLLALSLLIASAFLSAVPAVGQAHETGERKLITRVDPEYPDALKKLYIGGVVRVEVLGQSTMKAIKQWRYAPAASDETLTVKIEFDPHR